jgi:hypothetical protein
VTEQSAGLRNILEMISCSNGLLLVYRDLTTLARHPACIGGVSFIARFAFLSSDIVVRLQASQLTIWFVGPFS